MRKVVAVLGATGTGKSDLAVELALRFNGEVINADAVQMYKGMPIVTNKITPEEQKGVKHHLLGFLPENPAESDYSVRNFKSDTLSLINSLHQSGKLPIICGGTYYFMQNIIFNQKTGDPSEETEIFINNDAVTKENAKNYTKELYEMLTTKDPAMAAMTHPKDTRKILTYLLNIKKSGTLYSETLKSQRESSKNVHGGDVRFGRENLLIFQMDCLDKEIYEQRLLKRLDKMIDRGMINELEEFYQKYGTDVSVEKGIHSAPDLQEI